MDDYIHEWILADAKLKSIGAEMEEQLFVTLFFESFSSSSNKEYSNVISSLQSQKEYDWEGVSTRMLLEYASRSSAGPTKRYSESEQALNTAENRLYYSGNRGVYRRPISEMMCNFCGKKGHLEHFCKSYLEERDAFKKRKQDAFKDKVITETALTTSKVKDNSQYKEDPIVDSSATVHITSAHKILNESKEAQNTNISTTNGDLMPATSEGSSIVRFGKDRPPSN